MSCTAQKLYHYPAPATWTLRQFSPLKLTALSPTFAMQWRYHICNVQRLRSTNDLVSASSEPSEGAGSPGFCRWQGLGIWRTFPPPSSFDEKACAGNENEVMRRDCSVHGTEVSSPVLKSCHVANQTSSNRQHVPIESLISAIVTWCIDDKSAIVMF